MNITNQNGTMQQDDLLSNSMRLSVPSLIKYLDEVGANPTLHSSDAQTDKSLPVFFSQIYDIHRVTVFDRSYTLLICINKNTPTPAEVQKHYKLARQALKSGVVFVFFTLPSFSRKRLIQREIPFIVPGRHIYLPMVLIDLREKAKGGQKTPQHIDRKLSIPTQVLLLYQIQKQNDANDWPLGKWVDVLGYSRSTLTRVSKELSHFSLCRPQVRGRHVMLGFQQQQRELWETATPHLENPVRISSRAKIQTEDLQVFEAGTTALATFTMISAGHDKVYAMSSAAFRTACEEQKIVKTPYPEDDTVSIEHWKYPPGILSPDGHVVDRLSLYLSLRDNHDERIQSALTELLEGMQW